MGKTAIILGATGLTGSLLLEQLILDNRYSVVKLFSRTSCGFKDPKIKEFIVDVLNLKQYKDDFKGDEVFCCIGTTKAKTPNESQYEKIDFGIPVIAAKLCAENNIDSFLVVSALGADSTSKLFYNRTKGKMEEAVLNSSIKHTYILQPSLIGGDRKEKRIAEYLGKQFMKIVNPFLRGTLSKYRSIHPLTITKCMVFLANNAYPSGRIPSDEIHKIVTSNAL